MMFLEKVTMFVGLVAIIVACFVIALPKYRSEMYFFDVGQGDATLLQQGSVQMLVDGGSNSLVLAKLGDAIPFFDRRIEFVFVTHPDSDHFGGMEDVLERYEVGTVFLTNARDDTDAYRRFQDALRRNGAKIVVVNPGDIVHLSEQLRATVLWPEYDFSFREQNDESIVLRIDYNKKPVAFLLGDATIAVEDILMKRHRIEHVPFIKIGHHGSRTSTSSAFLDAIRPEIAIISVGKHNRYHHPSPMTIFRLMSRGIAVMRTDMLGDVTVVFDGEVPEVSASRRIDVE